MSDEEELKNVVENFCNEYFVVICGLDQSVSLFIIGTELLKRSMNLILHTLISLDKDMKKFFIVASALLLSASVFAGGMKKDLVDTAAGAGSFNTLVAAVEAAGLVETLKGEGPFTVFAPTDEAFAALPEGTVENLLKPENKDQLIAILTYHVLPGKVMAGDIAGKTMDAETVNGQSLAVNATEGVMINEATVTAADVSASNGVIHVIDKVLLPPQS